MIFGLFSKTPEIIKAIKANDLEQFKVLYQSQDDPMHKGQPLLAHACESEDITKFLLSQDVDVNHVGKDGWAAIHVASFNDYPNVVKLLISAGADINAQSSLGETPLHVAAVEDCAEVIQILIDNGADPHIENMYGETADI